MTGQPISEPFVEATVVRAQSPASARAGDSAVVRPDGSIHGFVGGACTESSVRLHSLRALGTGEPVLLRVLPGPVEDEGEAEEGAVTVTNPCLSGGAIEIFLRPRLPAPRLRIAGTMPIGYALADMAQRAGFAVELNSAEESRPDAGDAAVVIASHGHDEERVLTAALREGVPYVGLVASVTRGDAVLRSLDVPDELRARVRTPAGLDIGAHSHEEIALAILAEIVAMRHGHDAGARPLAEEAAGEAAEPAPAEPAAAARASEQPAIAIDPVCGMEVAISPASIQLERDGERFYFCSEGCRDSFAARGVSGAALP